MTDYAVERRRVTHPEGGRILTKQADAGDTDINVIVRRARQVGMLPPGGSVPRYGDFHEIGSFHETLMQVQEAQDSFMALPSKLRAFCSNDVGVFLDKVHTPEGLQQLLDLGLDPGRVPPLAPAPAPVEPAAAPASEPAVPPVQAP